MSMSYNKNCKDYRTQYNKGILDERHGSEKEYFIFVFMYLFIYLFIYLFVYLFIYLLLFAKHTVKYNKIQSIKKRKIQIMKYRKWPGDETRSRTEQYRRIYKEYWGIEGNMGNTENTIATAALFA